MPTAVLYNMKGENIGSMELNEAVFGAEINKSVLHQVVVNHLANQRQGTQSTKTRTEVRGGGIKPWRQKGTGRARQGSIRSPQWTGGGVALGPKPRDYRYRLNKKVRRLAVKSALSAKAQADEIIVIDGLKMDEIKTKTMAELLKKIGADTKSLIVTKENDTNVYRSARNIKNVKVTYVDTLNTYEILRAEKFVASKDAIEKIEEVLA
ncbi:MAG: 50S ribosomal protein L4 [Oscillospiraceae bacterium]|nr:50S ribosomal protein L4 [Oscillospiraceae bacterium]